MRKSMKSLIFPDVNVWLALNYEKHAHNPLAVKWYDALPQSTAFVFCRIRCSGSLWRRATGIALPGPSRNRSTPKLPGSLARIAAFSEMVQLEANRTDKSVHHTR